MFYYIPIEPLEERYTKQWYEWLPRCLEKKNILYTIIDGEPLCNTVLTGTFLDINSTLHYKSEQLKKIAKLFFEKKVKDGDTFFVADIEFWGIEAIKYLAVLNDINIKLVGFCHAASYTKGDFMQKCEQFANVHETAWFNTFDRIFVGSEYHKKQIIKNRYIDETKIVVTGNPYDVEELKSKIKYTKKIDRIICTNRPDKEKGIEDTLEVFERLKKKNPDWELIVTTSRKIWGAGDIREKALQLQKEGIITIKEGITKDEYFKLLAESKVMTGNTIEENFGYCVLEALICRAKPVVEDNYSHPELVIQDEYLFKDKDDQISKIEKAMEEPEYDLILAKDYGNVFNLLIELSI